MGATMGSKILHQNANRTSGFQIGTAAEGATALIAAVMKAAERRGREVNLPRGRFTLAAFLACIRRPLVTVAFLEELRVELLARGYILLDLGDVIALSPASSARRWTRVRTDMVDGIVDDMKQGKFDFHAHDARIAEKLRAEESGQPDDSND